MSALIIVEPMAIASVVSDRGTGGANLQTPDPKEVWADSAVGSPATLVVDLGAARTIDTVLLGYVSPPTAGASWSITGGISGPGEVIIQAADTLRVPHSAGSFPPSSHALWRGEARTVRFLAIALTQPAEAPPLTVGVLVIGKAFVAELGQEWGGGRRPIDTGLATGLPSGGFSVVEGIRKRSFGWTFGDLTIPETDQLELLALALGETRTGLVIEDAERTAGLFARIHYGLFEKWRAYERRNRAQTRWEISLVEWV